MEGAQKIISQKEYLKKYLSKDKKEKKKKVKISSSTFVKRSVIIDDDVPLADIPVVNEEEIINFDYLGDEAPQIAGFVDDRPLDMIWKPIGTAATNDDNQDREEREERNLLMKERYRNENTLSLEECPPTSMFGSKAEEKEYKSRKKDESDSDDNTQRHRSKKQEHKRQRSDADLDTYKGKQDRDSYKYNQRKDRMNSDSDADCRKERERSRKDGYNSDLDRRRERERRRRENNDYDYDRRKDRDRHRKEYDSGIDRRRNRDRRRKDKSDSDGSPNRKVRRRTDTRRRNDSDSDASVGRKRKKSRERDSYNYQRRRRRDDDSDASVERHRKKTDRSRTLKTRNESPEKKSKRENGHDSQKQDISQAKNSLRRGSDSDHSPPRPQKRDARQSLAESAAKKKNKDSDSDLSPPRKSNKLNKKPNYDSDNSPPRKNRPKERNSNITEKYDSDPSPPRKPKGEKPNKNFSRDQMDKTLDGKKAGLQSAKNLKEELKELKDNENRAFLQMDPVALGQSAATVVRDRKTGLKRDLEKEQEENKEKSARAEARKEKYDKWGKGLKQLREQEERRADTLHEMAKPLARYKDDEDLDKFLRARERDGDPMLDYIRKHQAESHDVIDLTSSSSGRKKYNGVFNPNRFGIAPGYRWDGVDRSNGYEQKWFETKSAIKAGEEEVYKWSVEDM
ncbi:BUD13 homolog [Cimex lectularius]|uniref:BUD13 homolog n=1 Tax=Cimex lectularius TaxID=79782 RepID=A0A8I6TKF6_CIMLE|nr:BUD13 homolog [Cimex lectularius]